MPVYTDQLGRNIIVDASPQRIVSLVPSQTELLYHFGLEAEVCGITKFCIHPDKWFKNKMRIGGTKTIDIGKIKSLQPHLIIANKEENIQTQVEELAKDYPVWISDVNNLNDALEMIVQLGIACGRREKAATIKKTIQYSFKKIKRPAQHYRTAYLIWKNPYMTVGGDTFINDMLHKAGFNNIFASQKRYPEISIEDLQTAHCQLLFLSSEPYPFKQAHLVALQNQLPNTKIIIVDGEMFSWYGSRLLHSAAYFTQLTDEISIMA